MKVISDTSLGLTGVPEAVPGGGSLERLGIIKCGFSAVLRMEGLRQCTAVSSDLLCDAARKRTDKAFGGSLRSCCNSHPSNDC